MLTAPRLLRPALTIVTLALLLTGCSVQGLIGEGAGSLDGSETLGDDNEPGDLLVTSPARASFISATAAGTVIVQGQGATDELLIDGTPVTPAADGSFSTTVKAVRGLNLIRLVDGPSALDVPFLYGDFAKPTEVVPAALGLRVNALGFADPDPAKLSVTNLAQHALDDVDLLASLQGAVFSGKESPAKYKFTVTHASYGGASLHFAPRAGGVAVSASLSKLRVEGKLEVKVILLKHTDNVVLSAEAIHVNGNIDASFADGGDQDAHLKASASGVQTNVVKFKYDSNNAGFPCCVDSIITKILRPKVRDAVQSAVQKEASRSVSLGLSDFGLPDQIDLSSAGLNAVLSTQQQLAGAQFDAEGAMVSVAAGIEAAGMEAGSGASAPGWLKVGGAPQPMATTTAFGIAVSLDTLNQALFAIWAQGGFEMDVDDVKVVTEIHIAPMLPPVLLAAPQGKLTAGLGEVVVTGKVGGNSFKAAINVLDDVAASIDGEASSLVLSMSAQPTISVTWLEAEALNESLRIIIGGVLEGYLPTLLAPLPLPSIPLDAVATSFADSVATLGPDTTLKISDASHRASIYGSLLIGQ